MPLPWVSRALVLSMQAHIDDLNVRIAASESRYQELLARYHTLVEPKPVVIPGAPPRDPIMDAINDAAGNDMKLRELMARQIVIDRGNGLTDTQIVARIRAGTPVADTMLT